MFKQYFGGVVSAIGNKLWKVICPQKNHVFLWLCVYNKVLTRDNIEKRRPVEDSTCLFCENSESVHHLFFECIVAQQMWDFVSENFGIQKISCFEEIINLWHNPKKYVVLNLVVAASLWSIWKLRNEFCFQGRSWRSVKCILAKLSTYLNQWKILCDDAQAVLLQRCIRLLDKRRGELLRIAWR